MTPLLSIIVPTKNRYPQLIETISSICKFINSIDLEVIIQDNSIDNSVFLKNFKLESFPFIKYFFDSNEKDSITNFNDAINNASGEYCIVIGDDDIVNPYILDVVKKVKQANLDSLIYPRGQYYWPDVKFIKQFKFFEPSSLQFVKSNILEFTKKTSADELTNILDFGGCNLGNGPCLYHGLVKKKVLDDIFLKFGSYVLGYAPDMSFTITLLLEKEDFYFTNVCLTIPGASYNSAAGMGRRGKHSTTLDNLPNIIPKKMLGDWDQNLPRIWTGYTFNAISIYAVLKRYEIQRTVDYKMQYKKNLSENIYDYKYIKTINKFINFPVFVKWEIFIYGFFKFYLFKLFNFLPSRLLNGLIKLHPYYKEKEYYSKINTINQCMEILKKYYKFLEFKSDNQCI